MIFKICSRCKNNLPESYFYKSRTRKPSFQSYCIPCKKEYSCLSHTKGTLEYFRRSTWGILNARTVNGSHPLYKNTQIKKTYLDKNIKLLFTKEQFYNFCEENKDKILNLYSDKDQPSIDRVDSSKDYSLDNIQIISLNENRRKGLINKNKLARKPIIATNLKTGEVKRYESAQHAIKDGFDFRNISANCYGKQRSHLGWEFKFEDCWFTLQDGDYINEIM
jgi:hypothetical protein